MEVSAIITGTKIVILHDGINNDHIDSINKKLSIFDEIMVTSQGKLFDNYYDIRMSEIDKNIRNTIKLENSYELQLEKFKNIELEKQLSKLQLCVDMLEQKNTITQKGIDGEAYVYDYINNHIKLNSNWSIDNVSKDSQHSSDIELIYKSLNCVIEVKNIKSKLSDSNIKKFNTVYINNPVKKYNSGIFVSLLSDYGPSTNVWDFCIKTINDKYVIYLANVKENPEKIILAMEILDQLNMKKIKDDKSYLLLEIINKQLKNYSEMNTNINKAFASIKILKNSVKDYESEIKEFLASYNL